MLKSHFCFYKDEVVRYINENKIKRENIQEIVYLDNQKGFVVFYWENEVLNG